MPELPKIASLPLQYLKENVGDEVDFLAADKHESFLQDVSTNLGVRSQACLKYLK